MKNLLKIIGFKLQNDVIILFVIFFSLLPIKFAFPIIRQLSHEQKSQNTSTKVFKPIGKWSNSTYFKPIIIENNQYSFDYWEREFEKMAKIPPRPLPEILPDSALLDDLPTAFTFPYFLRHRFVSWCPLKQDQFPGKMFDSGEDFKICFQAIKPSEILSKDGAIQIVMHMSLNKHPSFKSALDIFLAYGHFSNWSEKVNSKSRQILKLEKSLAFNESSVLAIEDLSYQRYWKNLLPLFIKIDNSSNGKIKNNQKAINKKSKKEIKTNRLSNKIETSLALERTPALEDLKKSFFDKHPRCQFQYVSAVGSMSIQNVPFPIEGDEVACHYVLEKPLEGFDISLGFEVLPHLVIGNRSYSTYGYEKKSVLFHLKSLADGKFLMAMHMLIRPSLDLNNRILKNQLPSIILGVQQAAYTLAEGIFSDTKLYDLGSVTHLYKHTKEPQF